MISIRSQARVAQALATILVIAASAGPEAGFAQSAATDPGSSRGVEEIVVTARKRAELLVDTPISVTALSETALRDAGVARLDEIQDLVPNLQFSVGRENQEGFIRLRGVGTGDGQIVFDPGVAVYIDGVFLPRMIGQLVDVVDVAQVEVLRGPQGTLFGKNSVGGAISITTIKPQPEVSGSALISAGRFGMLRTRATLNVPLVEDRILSRIAFATNRSQGYARNDFLGIDVSDRNALSVLGSLRFLVNDDLTIDVSGTWARDHGHGRGGQCRPVDERGLAFLVDGFAEECASTEPLRSSGNARGFSDASSYGLWSTITWTPPTTLDLTVKSITSWRVQKPKHRSDSDFTSRPIVSIIFSGKPDEFLDEDDVVPGWSQRQISQELQANLLALDGRLSLVGGAFAFWERGRAPTGVRALSSTLGVESLNVTRTQNWTWALYAQGVFDVTEWLSLTAGLRYTQDKKGASLQIHDIAAGTVEDPVFGSEVFDDWTPAASVALKAPDFVLDAARLDHLMTYFTWSKGFRGGGFNALINVQSTEELTGFDPETLHSFEVGVKAVAFDGRLNMNVSAFHSDYDDIQVTTTRTIGDIDDPTNLQTITFTQNAASATVQGIEAEFFAMPVEGLRIQGSLGLLNTEYDDFGRDCDPTTGAGGCAISDQNPVSTFIDRSGQGFNVSPDLTTQASIQYDLPIDAPQWPSLSGTLTPRIAWSYQSRMHTRGPELQEAIQPGFNLLHARLGYTFYDGQAQIAFWARNLTDERYFDRAEAVAILGFMARYYQSPRTYGAEFSYQF